MSQEKPAEPVYPTPEDFSKYSLEQQLTFFNSLPKNLQKILVGTSTFVVGWPLEMVRQVSELSQAEFEVALEEAQKADYIIAGDQGEVRVVTPLLSWINGPLMEAWAQQQENQTNDKK